jgi:hypothetical protein
LQVEAVARRDQSLRCCALTVKAIVYLVDIFAVDGCLFLGDVGGDNLASCLAPLLGVPSWLTKKLIGFGDGSCDFGREEVLVLSDELRR